MWLGLLAGAGLALAKIFRPKPGPSPVLDLGTPGGSLAPSPAAWPPLEAAVPTPTPVQIPEPEIEPVVAAAEPGLVVIGSEPLQEDVVPMPDPDPIPDPLPEPQPAPVPEPTPAAATPAPAPAPAPVKKVAVKKRAAPLKAAPAPPAPAPAKKAAPAAKKAAAPAKKTLPAWVDPKGTVCPKTHPVKGKLSSKIFQVPGNFAYERTTPDRCYKSADAAEDDGLRAAKR
jgi:hypothetical protein